MKHLFDKVLNLTEAEKVSKPAFGTVVALIDLTNQGDQDAAAELFRLAAFAAETLKQLCEANPEIFAPIRLAFVLVQVRELTGASSRDECSKCLVWVSAAHVQKRVAFSGLVHAIDPIRYGCRFSNMFCCFGRREIRRQLSERR